MSNPSGESPLSFYAQRESCLEAWDDPEQREELIAHYATSDVAFVPNLLPEKACELTTGETLAILRRRFGADVDHALSDSSSDPLRPADALPQRLRGPVAQRPDGQWIKRANVVGINLRTVGGFFGAVKYTLTLPSVQDAIHLLPFWEPGVVKSLYGICSWEINHEFFDEELEAFFPHLNDAERQLKATINLLHLMGKAVGMDVIPHTDRYSEMAICYPDFFEWLRRDGMEIVDHRANLHEEVMSEILAFLRAEGPATPADRPVEKVEEVFGAAIDERARQRLIFGEAEDSVGREERRITLVKLLHGAGLEPVPATMAPPYRGLAVDDGPEACTVDHHGMEWRDYCITEPQPMSRVFGPLARYKLYERLDDNTQWAIDFAQPRHQVWRYLCERYGEVQRRYGFDFMRGDMSHVQMRSEGPPPNRTPATTP